jgi:hypothetical protein
MAQLRDAKTSEVVFEGTPLDCVVAAEQLGGATVPPQLGPGEEWECPTELLYDDVGPHFDPDAVRKAAEENAIGLEGAAAEAKGNEAKRLGKAAEQAREALEPDTAAVRDASAAIEAARTAQEDALAAGG